MPIVWYYDYLLTSLAIWLLFGGFCAGGSRVLFRPSEAGLKAAATVFYGIAEILKICSAPDLVAFHLIEIIDYGPNLVLERMLAWF